MNTFMHGSSFSSFHFSFSISFPQIDHFYYFMSLHGLQDVENHCAHLRYRVEDWYKTSISPLSLCIILYIIGLESMKLQN